jgi:hypothetical protein
MSSQNLKPGSEEAFARIGCGALLGAVVGAAIVVATVSYWADSLAAFAGVVGLSVLVCALLGWRFGDRFFHSVHGWIGWFR